MGSIEIPPPEGVSPEDSWTATAKRQTIDQDFPPDVTTWYSYVITHVDGSRTLRSVTDKNGEKTTTEKKEPAPPGSPPKPKAQKPIMPPIGLPFGAGWKAKRSTLTDTKGVTHTETTYTIVCQGQEYTQVEKQVGDGEIKVVRAPSPAPLAPRALSDRRRHHET